MLHLLHLLQSMNVQINSASKMPQGVKIFLQCLFSSSSYNIFLLRRAWYMRPNFISNACMCKSLSEPLRSSTINQLQLNASFKCLVMWNKKRQISKPQKKVHRRAKKKKCAKKSVTWQSRLIKNIYVFFWLYNEMEMKMITQGLRMNKFLFELKMMMVVKMIVDLIEEEFLFKMKKKMRFRKNCVKC